MKCIFIDMESTSQFSGGRCAVLEQIGNTQRGGDIQTLMQNQTAASSAAGLSLVVPIENQR